MSDFDLKSSKGSRILVIFIVLAIIFAIGLSFYEYFIKKDFSLYIKETCDPNIDKCFLHQCEDGDTRCSSLPDGKFYYKIIYQKEYKAPVCTDADCPSITCDANDKDCSVNYCSDESITKFDLEDVCSF